MKDFFNYDETNLFFRRWLSNSPEIPHSSDTERFHEFVLSLFENGEELSESILTEAVKSEKQWGKETVDKFVESALDKYFRIREFYDFMKAKGRI